MSQAILLFDRMEPTIEQFPGRKLVGLSIKTTQSENKTRELWQNFRPRSRQLSQVLPGAYSVQIYPAGTSFGQFSPTMQFEKWAAVAVPDWTDVPEGLQKLEIPAGTYAKFMYQGTAPGFPRFAAYIFSDWLPRSGFRLAERPHFDYMPPEYKGPMHPEAEEEIWVPIL